MGATHQMLLAAAGAAPGLWTPANLTAAPKLWQNDSGSVTDAGSGACSLWGATSPATHALDQGTGANRPLIVASALNGRRGIRFDGTNDHFDLSERGIFNNVATGWCFFVWKRTVSTGGGSSRVLCQHLTATSNTRFAVLCDSAAAPDCINFQARRADADSTAVLTGAIPVNSGAHMALCTLDYANRTGTIYVDGTQDVQNTTFTTAGSATSATNSSISPRFGISSTGTAPFDGDMYETLTGSGAALLSAGEIDKLFGYAAHRWGLTSLLPALHPYKSVAPTV